MLFASHPPLATARRVRRTSAFAVACRLGVAASLALLVHGAAQAQSAAKPTAPANAAPLIEGQSVAITVQDMQADSLRMPPEMRSIVLQKPDTVLQVASNLYARRIFAERALSEGLDKDPQVQALLRVARDKVLSDAMLEHMAHEVFVLAANGAGRGHGKAEKLSACIRLGRGARGLLAQARRHIQAAAPGTKQGGTHQENSGDRHCDGNEQGNQERVQRHVMAEQGEVKNASVHDAPHAQGGNDGGGMHTLEVAAQAQQPQ